jgi:2-polyprenyl-3-methyl-5-hydroxy-6-metoxy-1,4-benzoquinol methylase
MACIDCAAEELSHVLGEGALELVRCGRCGLIQQARWRETFSASLYDYYAGPQFDTSYPPLNTVRHKAMLADFGRRVSGRRLLDVGCGIGHFVHTATAEGWEAEGIEFAEPAVAHCRTRGVNARVLDLMSDELKPDTYDLVTAAEVIEHVIAPGAFMARMGELLKPGGILYMTTPNFASLERMLLGAEWSCINPEHLSYFTPRTLRRSVQRAGLTPQYIRTRNITPAAIHRVLKGKPAVRVHGAGVDDELRDTIEGSAVLRAAKAAVNGLLNATGTGTAMVVLARKPG